MSADKRSVATDALATLGTIIDDKQRRDAIHLAVEPVVAGERLKPGEHILISNGVAHRSEDGMGHGIVDPFIHGWIKQGERFWFVMYPRMVHSLRHVWTHPAFPDEAGTPSQGQIVENTLQIHSIKWIEAYAREILVEYTDLIDSAKVFLATGDYLSRGGLLEGMSTSPEFWEHFQIATGQPVPQDKRENFFSCSC